MDRDRYKPRGYWTKEKCIEEALKYNSRKDFETYSGSSYQASRRNKWLDDVCSHMKKIGCKYKRCIYVYEFSNNFAYVGLTYNLNKRHTNRLKNNNDVIYKFIEKTKITPIFKQITDYNEINIASKLEQDYINEYINSGWNMLNKIKGGGLGGNLIKWTHEKCKDEALKYETRNNFCINSSGAYNVARKNDWLDEICQHMIELQKPKNHWTYDKCKEESLKYSTKTEFRENSNGAYTISKRNNWLKMICEHMHRPKHIKWTYEKCKEEASKYSIKSHFKKGNRSAFNSAKNNSWLDEICSHMLKN